MLPKKNRLPAYLIPEVLKKGKRFYSELFTLFISRQKMADNNRPRLVFIISKKIINKAVKRNQIKRRLSQIIEKNLEQIKKGTDIVFLVKKEITSKTFLLIKSEIERFLKKINLIEKKNKK